MNTMRPMGAVLSVLGFAFVLVSISAAQVTVEGQMASVDGTPLRGDVTLVRGGPAVQLRHYHTDGQGMFSLETDRTPGQLLVAKADGHVSAEVELDVRSAQIHFRFRLWPAGRVSGQVVDERGHGVAGATVHVRYPDERRRHHLHHEAGDIEADDFGYFTLPVVARGRHFVVEAATVEHLPGMTAPLKLEGEEERDIRVTPGELGQVVRGAVTDSAGNPQKGVRVRLRLFAGQEAAAAARVSRLHARRLNQRTVTGADGAYEFMGLPGGAVAVIAHRSGRPPVMRERVLPEPGFPGEVHVIDLIVD